MHGKPLMHCAILAAGEGARLGSLGPKPLLRLGGRSLLERLSGMLAAEGGEVSAVVSETLTPMPLIEGVRAISTGSALESLEKLLAPIPAGEKVAVFTVDSVFSAAALAEFLRRFEALPAGACLMGVTRFIDDEKPLYVAPEAGRIADFPREGTTDWVSAGVYGLSPEAREILAEQRAKGETDLSEYQRALCAAGVPLMTFDMGTVVDLDRPHDLEVARELFEKEEDGCR